MKFSEIMEISLVDIRPDPFQPRKVHDEAIEGLGFSIEKEGQKREIIVREKDGETPYMIVNGHHRHLAMATNDTLAKIGKINARIAVQEDHETDEDFEVAIFKFQNIDNIHNAVKTHENILNAKKLTDLGEDVSSIAANLGVTEATAKKYLKIADLPDELRTKIFEKGLSVSVALEIAAFPKTKQRNTAFDKVKRLSSTKSMEKVLDDYRREIEQEKQSNQFDSLLKQKKTAKKDELKKANKLITKVCGVINELVAFNPEKSPLLVVSMSSRLGFLYDTADAMIAQGEILKNHVIAAKINTGEIKAGEQAEGDSEIPDSAIAGFKSTGTDG